MPYFLQTLHPRFLQPRPVILFCTYMVSLQQSTLASQCFLLTLFFLFYRKCLYLLIRQMFSLNPTHCTQEGKCPQCSYPEVGEQRWREVMICPMSYTKFLAEQDMNSYLFSLYLPARASKDIFFFFLFTSLYFFFFSSSVINRKSDYYSLIQCSE